MQVQNIFQQDEIITFENYLNKMGIDNIQKYIKPPLTALDSCYMYDNIRECVNIMKFHILANDRIAFIIDPDMDGMCSSYMGYKYFKLQGVKKIRPFIQNGKERGLASESLRQQILNWQPDLIIIPDAGTNSAEWEDEFIDKDIDICVCDHHNAKQGEVCKRAVVVNNTMNQFECNRSLSGTGVMFKVLQALDYEMGTKYSNQFIDLVGISIISDSMDVRTYENRWFLKYILDDKEHIENLFMYELFDNLLNDTYTQRDIAFRIVPLFNSVIRCGTLEDKQKLFMAFCGKNIEDTIKMCQHYHTEQVNRVNKFIEHHQEKIDSQANSKITIIDAKDVPQAFSGLIAGRISGLTNKPCIVGKSMGGELGGSFRGNISIDVVQNLPHVTFCGGHENAFGIRIDTSKSQNLDDLRAEIDKMDISTIPTVIASFSANKLQMGIFDEFVGHDDLWGKELDKPRFYVYNIKVNSKDINLMGKNQDTIKIKLDGYEIMFFKLSMEQIEKFKLGLDKELNINLIGTLNVNEWRGRKTNQIFTEDFEIEEVTNTFEDLM